MIIDSHAHLDDPRFDGDREQVLERAWEAGVRSILTIGNGRGPDDMACGIPLAEKHDWILTTVGIHPHDAAKAEDRHFQRMRELAAHPKVVAIGEAGLDYYYDNSPRSEQQQVFRRQAELAGEMGLPLVVHTRDADEDTERILKEVRPGRGVLHCFTSGARLAKVALNLGFLISFSGIVTFPKAAMLRQVAREVPVDRVLIETDCPYLAPVPHRGKRNEPGFVIETLGLLARERAIAVEALAGQTAENFRKLFYA